jgi:hypothetical protein
MINKDILPALDKDLASKYSFCFDGYSDRTPQTETALLQAEMTIYKTMNDLQSFARKDVLKDPAADLPMNTAFWALVEKNYTRGEIRERFFGDKGASTRKELQYIPGDAMFAQWQQMLLTIDAQKKQQKAMEEQQQQQQAAQQQQQLIEQKRLEHDEADHQRAEEKHQSELDAQENAKAMSVVQSLQNNAKIFGASKATHTGGTILKNPINAMANN